LAALRFPAHYTRADFRGCKFSASSIEKQSKNQSGDLQTMPSFRKP